MYLLVLLLLLDMQHSLSIFHYCELVSSRLPKITPVGLLAESVALVSSGLFATSTPTFWNLAV